VRSDPFIERLTAAAVDVNAAQPAAYRCGHPLHFTQHGETHLRSYQKLGVSSQSAAIERAVDLRLLLFM